MENRHEADSSKADTSLKGHTSSRTAFACLAKSRKSFLGIHFSKAGKFLGEIIVLGRFHCSKDNIASIKILPFSLVDATS